MIVREGWAMWLDMNIILPPFVGVILKVRVGLDTVFMDVIAVIHNQRLQSKLVDYNFEYCNAVLGFHKS